MGNFRLFHESFNSAEDFLELLPDEWCFRSRRVCTTGFPVIKGSLGDAEHFCDFEMPNRSFRLPNCFGKVRLFALHVVTLRDGCDPGCSRVCGAQVQIESDPMRSLPWCRDRSLIVPCIHSCFSGWKHTDHARVRSKKAIETWAGRSGKPAE